jgi:hypothetical protein
MGVCKALDNIAYSHRQLSENIEKVSETISGKLQESRELLDSLPSLFGGRQWKRDDLDKDLEGPTIQSLLHSIAGSLKAMKPEPSDRPKMIVR